MSPWRRVAVVVTFVLAGACGGDVADWVSASPAHPFASVTDMRVSPDGGALVVGGTLPRSQAGFRGYGVELIDLTDGSSTTIEGLPPGLAVAIDWYPGSDQFVVGIATPDDVACFDLVSLVRVSAGGDVLGVVPLSERLDLGGGIAVVDTRFAIASAAFSGDCGAPRYLVWIDLETGVVDELDGVVGGLPARAAGGVVFLRDKHLRFLDLEAMAARDVETPGVGVLVAAGSRSDVVYFRGYDEISGEEAGLYSINLEVGPASMEFILPTSLNRLSLNDAGTLLAGFRPGGSRTGQIDVVNLEGLSGGIGHASTDSGGGIMTKNLLLALGFALYGAFTWRNPVTHFPKAWRMLKDLRVTGVYFFYPILSAIAFAGAVFFLVRTFS